MQTAGSHSIFGFPELRLGLDNFIIANYTKGHPKLTVRPAKDKQAKFAVEGINIQKYQGGLRYSPIQIE